MKGEIEVVAKAPDFLSFVRTHEGTRIFCAFNLSNTAQPAALPPGDWRQDKGVPFQAAVTDKGVMLPPFQAFFAVEDQ